MNDKICNRPSLSDNLASEILDLEAEFDTNKSSDIVLKLLDLYTVPDK